MKSNLYFFILLVITLLPAGVITASSHFIPLVGIPGLTDVNLTGDQGLNLYINALYRLSISIAALLAVIKIVAAGAKYMLTDIVPAKEEAKKDIQGALIGLLIVIAAVIILNTVNSDLTKVNFNLEPVKLEDAVPVSPIVKQCEDMFPGGGGCTYIPCGSIGNDLSTYLVDGALVGGVVGVAFPPSLVVSVPTGIAIGGGLYLLENAASCTTVCSWKGGKVIGSLGKISDLMYDSAVCVVPTDTEAAGRAKLAAAKENSCYRKQKDWDATSLSCSPNSCNINSNVKCCTANGGIITNNICAFNLNDEGNDNQNRINCNSINGRVWVEPSGPCRVISGREIVPETAFPLPIDVYGLNPDIPSELNEIKAACERGGNDGVRPFEYSRELNKCVQYQ